MQRVDRLPPHAPESEQGVLGCVLLSPNECMGQCIEKLKGGHEEFYDLRHQTIYTAMAEMYDSRDPIDIITLQQRLKDKKLLDEIGGIPYLNALQDSVPSAANLGYYLAIVREKALLRKTISTCTDAINRAYETTKNAEEMISGLEREILAIRPIRQTASDIKNLVRAAIDKLEERSLNNGSITGISTGLVDLDRKTDGFHVGEFIVVAGFPSTGKTALAAGFAVKAALSGVPTAIFSAEMHPVQLVVRALCSEARVNYHNITEGDANRLVSASGRIANIPLFIEPASGMTANQVSAIARRLSQKHGIKLFVVDYIQLLSGTGDNREQQISSVSKAMKSIALENNATVIGLSQLTDDGKLRESRAIGQDADAVWKLENDGEWQAQTQPITLHIEKCRDGETGSVRLTFLKTFTRFESASRVEM